MITGELKNKIDGMWDVFAAGGLVNPLDVIDASLEWLQSKKEEDKLSDLINNYNSLQNVTIDDIIRFHFEFECIHPFQDGNGRIGRFIYLKQLLDNRLALKYMNGESAKEYKKALGN